jgi:hypothetical protein
MIGLSDLDLVGLNINNRLDYYSNDSPTFYTLLILATPASLLSQA